MVNSALMRESSYVTGFQSPLGESLQVGNHSLGAFQCHQSPNALHFWPADSKISFAPESSTVLMIIHSEGAHTQGFSVLPF